MTPGQAGWGQTRWGRAAVRFPVRTMAVVISFAGSWGGIHELGWVELLAPCLAHSERSARRLRGMGVGPVGRRGGRGELLGRGERRPAAARCWELTGWF